MIILLYAYAYICAEKADERMHQSTKTLSYMHTYVYTYEHRYSTCAWVYDHSCNRSSTTPQLSAVTEQRVSVSVPVPLCMHARTAHLSANVYRVAQPWCNRKRFYVRNQSE